MFPFFLICKISAANYKYTSRVLVYRINCRNIRRPMDIVCGVCFIRCQKSCQKINSFLYFHFIYCYTDGVFFLHHQFLIISMANEPQQLHCSTGMLKYIQQPNGNYWCIQCSFVTVDHNSPKCLITMFQYFIRLLPLFRFTLAKIIKRHNFIAGSSLFINSFAKREWHNTTLHEVPI